MNIASIDWAHKKPLAVYFSDKAYEIAFDNIIDFLKSNSIDTIVGENLPAKLCLVLLSSDIKVLRSSGTSTKEYRASKGLSKTSDAEDAKCIYELYSSNPELFYPYTESDKQFLRAKMLYKLRENIMKSKVQYTNRINLYKKYGIFEEDIIEKLNELHDKMESEQSYFDRLFNSNEYFGKYIELFDDIKGVGPVTVAEIVSEIGNINRFPTQAKFLNYIFGYTGNGNHNHKIKVRLMYNVVDSLLMHKNEKYSQMYHDYKKTLEDKHPEKIKVESNGATKTKYNPAHLTKLTRRRMAREIAKLFYKKLKVYQISDNTIQFGAFTKKENSVDIGAFLA